MPKPAGHMSVVCQKTNWLKLARVFVNKWEYVLKLGQNYITEDWDWSGPQLIIYIYRYTAAAAATLSTIFPRHHLIFPIINYNDRNPTLINFIWITNAN